MDSNETNPVVLKSINAEVPVQLTFCCRTSRAADIFWLDYNGQRVKYARIQTGREFHVTTYETHPWVFAEADSNAQLVANGKEQVYFPSVNQNYVFVDIPVYSLREICLQHVRSRFTKEQIKSLDIPRSLIVDLLNNVIPPYDSYVYFDPQHVM